ncbi:MAG: YlbF family regulator [Clostridia bacterium]|nr:YlbF family regulator [Clostridia bacterium]
MKILDMAKALGEAIKDDPRTVRYQNAKSVCDNDKNLSSAINEYNVQKMALGEHLRGENPDHDVTDAIQRRVEELYEIVVSNPIMAEYRESEKEFNDFLSLVNMTISSGITGEEIGCTEEKCKTCGKCNH